MDTMAALALATELPTPELLERKPYGRFDALITTKMWRFILGHALYQVVVLLVLLNIQRNLVFFEDVDVGRSEERVEKMAAPWCVDVNGCCKDFEDPRQVSPPLCIILKKSHFCGADKLIFDFFLLKQNCRMLLSFSIRL